MRKGFWASFLKLSLYDHRFEHTHNIRVKLVGKTGVPFVGPLTVLYCTVQNCTVLQFSYIQQLVYVLRYKRVDVAWPLIIQLLLKINMLYLILASYTIQSNFTSSSKTRRIILKSADSFSSSCSLNLCRCLKLEQIILYIEARMSNKT